MPKCADGCCVSQALHDQSKQYVEALGAAIGVTTDIITAQPNTKADPVAVMNSLLTTLVMFVEAVSPETTPQILYGYGKLLFEEAQRHAPAKPPADLLKAKPSTKAVH